MIGALAGSLCFLLPSAALMIAFAYGVTALGDLRAAGWLHGLEVAAVAVVAQAVWTMGAKLCTDRARVTLCLAAAAGTLIVPGAFGQVAVLALGALAGWRIYRGVAAPAVPSDEAANRTPHAVPVAALVAFGALLVVPRLVASATGSKSAAVFDTFYRAGALVFGGGHVVLPLLRESVVPRGWMGDDAFLAGYAGAQAVPGPLFSFAGYLVAGGGHPALLAPDARRELDASGAARRECQRGRRAPRCAVFAGHDRGREERQRRGGGAPRVRPAGDLEAPPRGWSCSSLPRAASGSCAERSARQPRVSGTPRR